MTRMGLGKFDATFKIAIGMVSLYAVAHCHPIQERKLVREGGVQTGHPNVRVFYAYPTISPPTPVSQNPLEISEGGAAEELRSKGKEAIGANQNIHEMGPSMSDESGFQTEKDDEEEQNYLDDNLEKSLQSNLQMDHRMSTELEGQNEDKIISELGVEMDRHGAFSSADDMDVDKSLFQETSDHIEEIYATSINSFNDHQEPDSHDVVLLPEGNKVHDFHEESISSMNKQVQSSDNMGPLEDSGLVVTSELQHTERVPELEGDLFPRETDVHDTMNVEDPQLIPNSNILEVKMSDIMNTQNEDEFSTFAEKETKKNKNQASLENVEVGMPISKGFNVGIGGTKDMQKNEETLNQDENQHIEVMGNNKNSGPLDVGDIMLNPEAQAEDSANIDGVKLENLDNPSQLLSGDPSNTPTILESGNFDSIIEDSGNVQLQDQNSKQVSEILQRASHVHFADQENNEKHYPVEGSKDTKSSSHNFETSLASKKENIAKEYFGEETPDVQKSQGEMPSLELGNMEQPNFQANSETMMLNLDGSHGAASDISDTNIVDLDAQDSQTESSSPIQAEIPNEYLEYLNDSNQEENFGVSGVDENLLEISEIDNATESILGENDSMSEPTAGSDDEPILQVDTPSPIEAINDSF